MGKSAKIRNNKTAPQRKSCITMKSPQDNIAVILKGVTCLYARLTYSDYTHIFQASRGTLWDTPSAKDLKSFCLRHPFFCIR